MGRLETFVASVNVASGMKPKGDYPLMEAHDIVVDDSGTRLDDKLNGMSSFTTDNTLTLSAKRVLSVNMATADDRTLPIKASDMDAVVGNIGVLLKTI